MDVTNKAEGWIDEQKEGKPVVQDVTMTAANNKTGADMPYEDFVVGVSAEDFADGYDPERIQDPQQAKEFIQEAKNKVLADPEDFADTLSYITEYLRPQEGWNGGNTYNWGYWGPVVQFWRDPEFRVVFFQMHKGGDVRVNYGDVYGFYTPGYPGEAPWYQWYLIVEIETDQGVIRLDNEDDEAYYFIVQQDRTGTFSPHDTIEYPRLEEALDWSEADRNGLW